MSKTIFFPLLLSVGGFLAALPGVCADAIQRSVPGFHVERLEPIQASIQIPDGWHFRSEQKNDTTAFFVTREPLDTAATFKIGLTINCVRHVTDKAHVKPSKYIDAFTRLMDTKESITNPRTNNQGPFNMIWFDVDLPNEGRNATHVKYFLIANDTTDTMYIMLFEAPQSEWTEAYEKGVVMLKNIVLDVTF